MALNNASLLPVFSNLKNATVITTVNIAVIIVQK